jgi:acetolactate synthase-1/3 small subunit
MARADLQVPVWAVLDYTNTRCVERELLLAKVSTLGPEFSHNSSSDSATSQAAYDSAIDQTAAPPSFVANDGSASASDETLAEKEAALARSFENSSSNNPLYPSRRQTEGMSASEALIAKNLHFNAIKTLAEQFGGRIVDVGENDCIVQLTAKSLRVNAFLNLMRTFGVLEAARSGELNLAG